MRRPKPIPSQLHQESYSPEFKLRVVLEYVRTPKRKKRICQANKISADLLDAWHREFSARAAAIFSPSSASAVEFQLPKGDSVANAEQANAPAWGIRINKAWHDSIRSPSTPFEQPKWLKPFDRQDWDKRGVLLWDSAVQKFAFVHASQALELLDILHKTKKWRKKGIPLTWHGFALDVLQGSRRKRARGQRKSESTPEEKIEFILNPQASLECFAFLDEHASLLQELAEADEKERGEILIKAYGIFFKSAHEEDEKKIDLAVRPLPWVHNGETHKWVCDQPPNRGTVTLAQDNWFWQGCIERPDHFKHESPSFFKLEEALAWTEEQLLALKNPPVQDAESETESFREPFQPETDLAPYWIDPGALEPERKLFRVAILLHCQPESSKTMEMSFGKLFHYDKKYPTPAKLLRELHLDGAPITIEQIAAPYSGLYQIFSAAMYYQGTLAQQQAQQLWDQSTIVQKYKEGKIEWAQYGYEEVETNYCTWLGMLHDPEDSLDAPVSRDEHMRRSAMELTLIHALALEDYRQFRKFSHRWFSDEDLLVTMHEKRAKYKYIPTAARLESEQWLRQHPRKSDV